MALATRPAWPRPALHIRDLTFRITTVTAPDGKPRPAVECEGVIVDRSP
jgi:hypothetical protein